MALQGVGRSIAVVVLAVTGLQLCGGVAAAAPGPVYGVFALADGGGTMELAPGFPDSTFATDSAGPTVPTGASTYLNANTPVGAVYGSSVSQGYLNLRSATGSQSSTTTYTFTAGTPSAGWSFVLGDVDADIVTITATSPDGVAVAVSEMGYQGVFNYCLTPIPSSCTGATPGADVPSWNSATGVLTGGGTDTSGASAWFTPSVSLGSLTFVFTEQSGGPIYQTWFATLTRSVAGSVTDGNTGVAGVQLDILDEGNAVVGQATSDADGNFSVDGLAPGSYTVRATPPSGYEVVGSAVQLADLTGDDRTGIDFEVTVIPPPTTELTPTQTTSTSTSPTQTTSTVTTPTSTTTRSTTPTVTTPTQTTSTSTTEQASTTSGAGGAATSSTSSIGATATATTASPARTTSTVIVATTSGGSSLAATGAHTAELVTVGLGLSVAGFALLTAGSRRGRGGHAG